MPARLRNKKSLNRTVKHVAEPPPLQLFIKGHESNDWRAGLAIRACVIASKRAVNKKFRRQGIMVDNGSLEVESPQGKPIIMVWAIYQFFESVQREGGSPISGLAIAYCPAVPALALYPLDNESSVRSLELAVNTVRGVAENGFCEYCHTYRLPANPYEDFKIEHFLGQEAFGDVCSECGAWVNVSPLLQVL